MTTPFVIGYLADRPDLVPLCARWEHEEWGKAGGKTLAQAAACYVHSRRDGLPLTLVAMAAATGAAMGMASLWDNDCPLRPELTPWAASLYVAPQGRGQGIGTALFARIQDEARRLGIARLHLMTQHSEAVYAGQGWHRFDRIDGPGAMRDAVLMYRDMLG